MKLIRSRRTNRVKFKPSHSDSVRYVKSKNKKKTTFPKAVQELQETESKAAEEKLDEVEDRDEQCYENTNFISE